MSVSPMGFVVCAAILVVGYFARAPLIAGLVISLGFGSTALMTLAGSSPLIYTFFAALLLASVAFRPRIWRELGNVFGSVRPVWVLCILMIYGVVGSLLFPRLFAGQTSVFVVDKGKIVESTLAPVSGNVTQVGYFVLGGLTAIAVCLLLLQRDRIDQIRRGFLLWCTFHAAMGLIDLLGKLGGMGDVLGPIRTATYAMITEAEMAGFVRIAGAFSEASSFGGVSLATLAFSYTYWRMTGSRYAKWLAVLTLCLLLLSTSSTAYAGLLILCVGLGLSIVRSVLSDRLQLAEISIVGFMCFAVFFVLAISVFNEKAMEPVQKLVDSTLINKMDSESGQERTYWNVKSLESLVDTRGMGIGFGSSRASSWIVAALSQLGVLGALMLALMVFVVLRGLGGLRRYVDAETEAVVSAVRASAIGSMVAGSLISGTADPGMVFCLAFAVIAATRVRARQARALALAQLDPTRPGPRPAGGATPGGLRAPRPARA